MLHIASEIPIWEREVEGGWSREMAHDATSSRVEAPVGWGILLILLPTGRHYRHPESHTQARQLRG